MRELEEARDGRARGAELREERRERREAGPAGTDPRRAPARGASPAAAARASRPSRATWSRSSSSSSLVAGGVAYAVTAGLRRRRRQGRQGRQAGSQRAEAGRNRGDGAQRHRGAPASPAPTATRSSARASSSARSPTAPPASPTASSCSSAATRREAHRVATALEISRGAADDARRSPRSPAARRSRCRRRGQCLVGGLAPGRGRLRPARPRHGRRLRLVAAAEARPAGPRPGHLRRPPEPAAALHPQRRLPLRPRSGSASASPSPTTRTVQVVKPGGKLIVTLARDTFLKRYHFHTFYWDGRSRTTASPPPGRYKLRVKLLGQDRVLVPPGTMRLHRAPRNPIGDCRPAAAEGEAVSDFLAGAGVLVAAAAAAAAILLPAGRARAAAMLAALVLFPVLILGDQWHSHQIVDLRDTRRRLDRPRRCSAAGGAVALAYVFQPLADPAAAGDRRRAAVPRPPARRGRHGQPARPALPGDRRGVLSRRLASGSRVGASIRVLGPSPAAVLGSPRRPCETGRRPPDRPPRPAAIRPGRGRASLCAADALLRRLLEGAAERLLLLRAVLAGLRVAARRQLGPEAADPGPLGGRGRGGRFVAGRLGRVLRAASCSGTTR